jgi:hypothetical protein
VKATSFTGDFFTKKIAQGDVTALLQAAVLSPRGGLLQIEIL